MLFSAVIKKEQNWLRFLFTVKATTWHRFGTANTGIKFYQRIQHTFIPAGGLLCKM